MNYRMSVKELKEILKKHKDIDSVCINIDYANSDDYPDEIEEGCDTGCVATFSIGDKTYLQNVQEM